MLHPGVAESDLIYSRRGQYLIGEVVVCLVLLARFITNNLEFLSVVLCVDEDIIDAQYIRES